MRGTTEDDQVGGSDAADKELMQQLASGDDLALNQLMERWKHPVFAFVLRSVGNEAEAMDLAQEVFVRVYEARSRYEARTRFSTWLFTIAANLCRNHARWRSRHPTVPLDDVEPSAAHHAQPAAGFAPDKAMLAEERAAKVRDAIGKLPQDLKEAVVLFEYHDLSYQQIAEIAKCSVKAVETRIYRAKQLLKTSLKEFLVS